MIYTHLPSPLGDLLVVRADRDAATGAPGGMTGLYLPTGRHATTATTAWERDDTAFADAASQLGEYFAGTRRVFDLPLAPRGTVFQNRIWAELDRIPFGQTSTYGAIAATIGSPTASRAVGLANGQNPISIIVPCHRVVGATGSLTGYGGGLEAKRWLLDHEARVAGVLAEAG